MKRKNKVGQLRAEKGGQFTADSPVIRGKKTIDKFNHDVHARFWKKYKVRPNKGAASPEKTDSRYCVYDEPNESYLYTQDWIDFLIEKMADENEYNSLY